MALQNLNRPTQNHMPPNTGDGTEFGDKWDDVLAKLNTMFAELYGGVGGGQAGIIAGTTRTQAGATPLTSTINRVDTSTAPAAGTILGDGVALPTSAKPERIYVVNNTANIIQVYALNGSADTINNIAGATGVALPPGDVGEFVTAAAGAWNFEAGVGSSGALPLQLAVDNLTATGANQGTALALVADFHRVTSAPAGTGVILPVAKPGLDIFVFNHGGGPVQVYGNGTDTIDDIAGATGVSQMNRSVVLFTCYGTGAWATEGLATGYSPSGLQTVQFTDGIAAAGTTQGTATPLTGQINTVATVAAGTGVNLPAGGPGLAVTVINNGANALTVYPAQGAADTINGFAATVGVSLSVGAEATFNQTVSGAWTAAPATTKNAAYNASASAVSFTATGAQITGGAAFVELDLTGNPAGAANVTLPTVAQMTAAMHSPLAGSSFLLRIRNFANTGAWTVVTNTGWTLSGAMTVAATPAWTDFVVTLNTLTTATLQRVGAGTVL